MSANLQAEWDKAIARMAPAEQAGDTEAIRSWEDTADQLYARITGEAAPDTRLPGSLPWWASRWFRFVVLPALGAVFCFVVISSMQNNAERDAERTVGCGVKYGFDRADRTAIGDIAYKACMEAED
jgi:hypothetical protein